MATATQQAEQRFADLTAFQRDLLAIVAREGAEYGLGLKQAVQPLYDKEINHGQLYPNLDSLVEKGQIDRRTNSYELTTEGQRLLQSYQAWLSDCVGDGDGDG